MPTHGQRAGALRSAARLEKEILLISRPSDDVPEDPKNPSRYLQAFKAVRQFNIITQYLAGVVLIGMLILTVADIIGRSAFNNPVPGTVEITSMIMVVVVFLAVARSEDLGDHIAIDLIYERLSPRFQLILDVFADLLTIVVLGLLSYQLYDFGLRNVRSGAETPVLQWPFWPFVFVAAFGTALYTLSTVMRLTLRLTGEPVTAVDPSEGESGGIEI